MSTTATKRRIGIVGAVVLALVAGLLVWFATRSDGEIVRKADLNDGGIWVTNAEQARYGRVNKPAGQLDAGVLSDGTSGSGLDIFQDGSAVVGLSRASNQIVPINAAEGTLAAEQSIALPKATPATGNRVFTAPLVDLRGGTIATIDPAKGQVRAQQVDTRTGITALDQLQSQAKPLATVGGNAAVAVGVDGAVHALSAEKGVVVTLRRDGAGFTKPVQVSLGFSSASAQVTAVGPHWVVWDAVTGMLYSDALDKPAKVSVGTGEPGTAAYAALQQPGPDADSVLIEDSSALSAVPLSSDARPSGGVTLAQAAPGQQLFLSPPVRLGSCIHGAWAGPTHAFYGRNCGSPGAADTADLGAMKKGVRVDGVKLRVNRGLIVLNDLDSGGIWDLDRDEVKIDNWNSVIPPPQTDDKNPKKDENLVDDEVSRTPPKALPDNLQVRAGRTSTLHVLDNDADSQGSILAISPGDVGAASVEGIGTSASADGQTVQVTVPAEPAAGSFSFSYTVNNGTTAKNGRASAKVTVRIVGPDVNTPPTLRPGQSRLADATYPVVASGSVKVGVIADWRDAENDPLQITPGDPRTGVDGAGALTIKAQATKGDQTVDYHVEDGRGGATKASVTLGVLGDDDKPVAPKTQPDVLRAVVGKPVQLQPLGNDVPGADPSDPEARMRLAQDVQGPGQLTIDTNLDTNVLTVTGRTPGTSTITYAAQSGSGVAVGRVRVDILPPPSDDLPPVATPDSAVVRGQIPVVADVLTNDYSPRSDVLVVQRVTTDSAWLRVSVVQGRWIRAVATAPVIDGVEKRGTVEYTISDGTKTAVGQLSVVQKEVPQEQTLPTVVDDNAIVRVGDAVTVPVLDNDSMSEGIPLALDPGGVRVVSGGGQAFASGTVVRYVPDAKAITSPTNAIVEYATYPEGLRARAVTGRVSITVNPLPDPVKRPDAAPSARSFSASVTAGDTLSITVPTSGVDPDGDLTFVSGIVGEQGQAVDLELGRVIGFGAATIRYEAYPRSAGTEVIRYELRDRFGLSSEGFVRVGVVQPGDPQPPVAVEDDIVAAPGRTVHVDLLANDLVADGDSVQFEDFATLNDGAVLKDFQKQKDLSFKAVAPPEGPAKVLTYGITDGLFDPSRATLTVRGRKDFNNPPVAVDDTGEARPGETSILVDALANDRDLDGDRASLRITSVIGDGAAIEGRKVRITLRPEARVVPYVIEDADGAVAMALIYVPAGDNGLPYVVQAKPIRMSADSTVELSLADYVVDPRGGTVSLTSPDTVSTAPSDNLQQEATSATTLTLTSTNGYVGPAALMLEVTNAVGASDKGAQATYVSIPVQIGPDIPVLRCPSFAVSILAGGDPRRVDIPRLCHAWIPTGMAESAAVYEAAWDPGIDAVSLDQRGVGGRQVVLAAKESAPGGATGSVVVRAKGSGESFRIGVRVIGAPKQEAPKPDTPGKPAPAPVPIATLRPMRIDGLVAGTSQQVDVAQFLDSKLGTAACSVTGVSVASGSGVSATTSGCRVTVTATARARGEARLLVRAVDGPGRPPAVGEIVVTLRGRPDAMAAPVAVADRVLGGTARVDWRPPAYDGGLPIQEYEVRAKGGPTQKCSAAPCTISGLTNGTAYTFTVRSRNAVGWSDPSPASNSATPDKKPEATQVDSVVAGDRTLTVRWAAPVNKGSAVTRYRVQWIDVGSGAGGGGQAEVAAPGLSKVITGLVNNDAYQVRVQARNGAGWGPYGPQVKGQSFGRPAAVSAPTLAPRTPTPSASSAQVTITWPATNPNGPAITTYDVFRRTGGGAWQSIASVSGGAQRVATDSIPYRGQQVQYVVTATNGGPATSAKANVSSYVANGIPQTPTLRAVTTPKPTYAANASFSLGDARASGYQSVRWRTTAGRSGSWGCSGGCSGASASNLGTAQQSMQISACNVAGQCSPWSNAVGFHPFGPTQGVPNLRVASKDGNSITFRWGTTASNGRPITGYVIEGDRNQTVGAGTHETTFTKLGYSTTRTIRVRAIAQDSGPGPFSARVSGRTDPKPPPPALSISVKRGGQCAPTCTAAQGCTSQDCQWVTYTLGNFTRPISCAVSGWSNPDNGTGGSHEPVNGFNRSNKFYGFPNGSVTVTCRSADGRSKSATKNPWGG